MIILIDSNEHPLKFTWYRKPVETEIKKLYMGDTRYSQDYALKGYETEIGVQFKRLNDLYGSLGHDRDRFMSNIEIMVEHIANPYLVIAASPNNIFKGCVTHKVAKKERWKRDYTNLTANSLFATLFKVSEIGVKVRFYKNDREAAKKIVSLFREFLKFKEKGE